MFDKSLKYNICLSKDFSDNKISESLQISGADKFINNMEKGLNSLVGENGSDLSGKQK
ncbi:ABC transporter ATP-binding protein [Acidilutibacter cellobiosedens]|jgi:ABC-type bacteriocin/lantibiotic exporter with double-glycine peptidase domain|uniref:ABC transporter ATP-binding protein n=1 Tax=Acidilutibacter cellobiosedens TaxID=2507161 RepID=UPI0013759616|nr:ABC transporter ATP-binding protein [Acidilutibacter cellobiosedens]